MAGFIGAIVGFWALGGSWIGAILGYFVGRYFGRGLDQNLKQGFQQHAHASDIFYETLFSLLGYLAKADGRVSENEIAHAEVIMTKLGISGDRRQEAIRFFKSGSQNEFDISSTLSAFSGASRFRPDLKRHLFVFLVEMAMADDELDDTEERVLRQAAAGLHIDPNSFENMLEMLKAQHHFAGGAGGSGGGQRSSSNELAEAYQALGVSSEASDKEVKRAYRKLMSQYHPDKMIAKGVPEDMLAMATEKAQEIQSAYDVVERSRK